MIYKKILKKYWGYTSFKPAQEEIIKHIVSGKDTLAILPTGSGKSVIYQVAALSLDGITIVISPLIALIEDQVNKLNSLGVKSIAITGSLPFYELERLLDNAQFSNTKFLFISPERLKNTYVLRRLEQMNISFFTIDEAHCISEWGHDFRPSYLKISVLKELFPNIAFLALTATASKRVKEDIIKYLKLKEPKIIRQSIYRNNLAFKVVCNDNKQKILLEIIRKNESAIIYVRTRKRTYQLAKMLHQNGFKAEFFHGGMLLTEKQVVLRDWKKNKIDIIVATTAFGMGIDKHDVRKVIHYDLPYSIENYIQEAGRGGRDNKYSEAIIIHSKSDIDYYKSVFIKNHPKLENIIEVYKKLYADYHIAEGEGENLIVEFDYENFCKKFNLDLFRTLDILKILESEEIILLRQNNNFFSEVQIIVSPNRVRYYINNKQKYYEILELLVRMFSDIFYQQIKILPSKIINILNLEKNELEQGLLYLNSQGIIKYKPQGKHLEIRFLVRKDKYFLQRKLKDFKYRLKIKKKQHENMLSYVLDDKQCRAKHLASYFGDELDENCGICDICNMQKFYNDKSGVVNEILRLLEKECLSKTKLQTFFYKNIDNELEYLFDSKKISYSVKKGYCLKK